MNALNNNNKISSSLVEPHFSEYVIENLPEAVFTISPKNGILLTLNKAFETITGFKQQKWIGSSFSQIVHPDDLSFALQRYNLALEGKTPPQMEIRILTKSGNYIDANISVVPYIREGEVKKIIGIGRDITNQKEKDLKLQQSEEQFRKLFDDSNDIIIIHGLDGKIIDVNLQCEKKFGFSKSELQSMNVKDLIEKSATTKYQNLNTNIGDAKLRGYEINFKNREGSPFPALISSATSNQEDRIVVYLIIRDISSQKEAEYKLINEYDKSTNVSRQLLAVLNTINEGIITINSNGEIIRVNQLIKKMFGYEDSELMGQDLTKLMPEEYRKAHTEGLSRYKKTRKARVLGKRLELKGQRKSGKIFPLEISITKTDTPDGQYFTGALRDISERKKVEGQIETANKELKDFAYIVSHDLKAPLRGITSLATWLKQDYSNKLDDDGKENIDLIISRVQRMSNLIEGILRYSKIGRIDEQISRINTNDLVINIIDSINPPNNIKISIDGKLPEIYCEGVTLEQVFQNLINNAIKFMDKPDGKILISCEENEQFWLFKIEDNGPGIEKKYQDKIFHIFQTLNPRDDIESTGIGLTIVKKIIENYKGKIWFDSEIGKGTVFCFTIPKTLGDKIL